MVPSSLLQIKYVINSKAGYRLWTKIEPKAAGDGNGLRKKARHMIRIDVKGRQ